MLSGFLTCVIRELTGDEARAELELVKYLSAKAISLGMSLDTVIAYDKLRCGIAFVSGKIYLLGTVGKRKNFLCLLALVIVYVTERVENGFADNDFTVKLDRVGNCLDKSTFVVDIIILFFRTNVNRTDDISAVIVDIEKLRTS